MIVISLDKQVHIYSVDTGSFYKRKENALHWKIHQLTKEKREIESKLNHIEEQIIQYTSNTAEKMRLENEYNTLSKWKSYKIKLANETKERLLEQLSAAVEYNNLNPKNKYIRKLNQKALIDKNVISIFESTLTRTLGIQTNTLSTDIMVIQVFYFDVIEDLIVNGFEYNGHRYKFLTASAGQIRTKKTVFIREELWNQYERSFMCGLTLDIINERGGINVNKFLAYLALSNSATDLWTDFDIDRCIVVPDFATDVNGEVDFIDDKTYNIERKIMDINIEHTDGCGMILPSLSRKNFMVRCPWVKGLLASFDFRKFIEERNCPSTIKDIYGVEHDVIAEDIQIIFTKSQFKANKYYENWQEYKDAFKKYNCQCGICNMEEDYIPKATINYQMLQSLTDITDKEILEITKKSRTRIHDVGGSIKNMLDIFNVNPNLINQTPLQQALKVYPELLNDEYCKIKLKDITKSLIKGCRSGKLNVNGKYLFLIPDLYAACEFWFCQIKKPKGLLADKEVFCRVFKSNNKLACLRSPHLYREWAIRHNVVTDERSEWFQTNAIYTSSYDLISKLLQFDCDGDKSLVLTDKTLIEVAERNMEGIVPLFYNMLKAPSTFIDNEKMYHGMCAAWTGGNIGTISNNITKIWNSGEMTEEKYKAIKWLCAENNFIIDYAKTLYKPVRPAYVNQIITKYTRAKMPHFFKYAKDYKDSSLEPINDSFVNKLEQVFKNKRIVYRNLPKLDYKKLMDNPNIIIDQDLIKVFDKLNRTYHYKLNNKNSESNNINYIAESIRSDLSQFGYSSVEISDMLIKYLYTKKTKNKASLWFCYGYAIVRNIYKNINPQETYCLICGQRFKKQGTRSYCDHCREEIQRSPDMKTIKCVDCGKEFVVPSSNKRTTRCPECRVLYNRYYEKIKKRRQRQAV